MLLFVCACIYTCIQGPLAISRDSPKCILTKPLFEQEHMAVLENNIGPDSDIFQPFWHSARPKKNWVRHLAEHHQMTIKF